MVCQFLLYNKVDQLYIYMSPYLLPLASPSLPPSHPPHRLILNYPSCLASWAGALHTLPFLLMAPDFQQLVIVYLLHIFDMPLGCAVSGQVYKVMLSPLVYVLKVLFILNTCIFSLKFLLILLAWKKSSQGYSPTLTAEMNLSFLPNTVDNSTHHDFQSNPGKLEIKSI